MMNIQEIYKQYRMTRALAAHQMRVAGVAQVICRALKGKKVDAQNIITACLLHDMGNIIKFNLDLFPEFLQPEGKAYWNSVQKDYMKQYGTDEQAATLQIVKEVLGDGSFSQRVLELIDGVSFSKEKENYESDDFGKKICAYADMRVEPHGVVSLADRLKEGRKRYGLNKPGQTDPVYFPTMAGFLKKIETQIFDQCSIRPDEITENIVEKEMKKLRNYSICPQ